MRYKRGDRWWLDNDELVMLAASEQRARFEGDEWEGLIREYLRGQRTGVRMALRSQPILEVSVAEILTKVFGIDPKDWRQCDQNRVAKCLVNLGFRRTRKRTADGSRPYWYVLSAKAQSNHS